MPVLTAHVQRGSVVIGQSEVGVCPSVLCDVISVVAEFMVSATYHSDEACPSVLCDGISVVAEFMVSATYHSDEVCPLVLQHDLRW
jgi:hypothetical protein